MKIKQVWKCKRCGGTDRTDYKEDPNKHKCYRCGEDMETLKVIKMGKCSPLVLP